MLIGVADLALLFCHFYLAVAGLAVAVLPLLFWHCCWDHDTVPLS